MQVLKAGRGLSCGCCGEYFKTWTGYIDQDQDRGYGICKPCQGLIEDHNKKETQKLIDCFRSGLKKTENIEKFDSFEWEEQARIAMDALKDGLIKMSIRRN